MDENFGLIQEATREYFPSRNLVNIRPTNGGCNNWVFYVSLDCPDETFVLRIYNNGLRIDKIEFEHAILEKLKENIFSFSIPTLISIQTEETKRTFVSLSNGMFASIFELINGSLPHLTCVREIGQASGELALSLSNIQFNELPSPCPTPPYYDFWWAHPGIQTQESFVLFCENFSEFQLEEYYEDMHQLIEETVTFAKDRIPYLLSLNLPKGWIHGDLHHDNVLCEEGIVTAILDFEFTAWDFRAMELAICLSKYAGELDPLPLFDQFISGFAMNMQYTYLEASILADLISLRILSNVIYFTGRIKAGENKASELTSRVKSYLRRLKWLRENREKLAQLQIKHFQLI